MKPTPTVKPKNMNIRMMDAGSLEGIIGRIWSRGVPNNPVTQRSKGRRTAALAKNSPVNSPMMVLLIPMQMKIRLNFSQPPSRMTRLVISIPRMRNTSPCPASPNMMPNSTVKKIATKGVGSTVPYSGEP